MNPDVLSAIGSVGSALIAMGAMTIAFFAWRTSINSARAAQALTTIERVRLHSELLPEFEITTCHDDGWGRTHVIVELIGPPLLDRLDSVRAVMRPAPYGGSGIVGSRSLPEHRFYDFSHPNLKDLTVIDGGELIQGETVEFVVKDLESGYPTYVPIRLKLVCKYRDYDEWVVPIIIPGGKRLIQTDHSDYSRLRPKARRKA